MKLTSVADLSRSQWIHLINEWIFNERDKAIIIEHHLDGRTYERIAEEYDMSTQRVKQIVYQAEKKLMRHIS